MPERKVKEKIRIVDERTVEVSLPNVDGYERIAMECSASFAKLADWPESVSKI